MVAASLALAVALGPSPSPSASPSAPPSASQASDSSVPAQDGALGNERGPLAGSAAAPDLGGGPRPAAPPAPASPVPVGSADEGPDDPATSGERAAVGSTGSAGDGGVGSPSGTGATGPTATTTAPPASVSPAASLGPAAAEESLASVRAGTLARISYPWARRLPGWTIEFLPGRADYLGATWSDAHRIEIYVRDGQSIDELAFTLAHELGHAVDLTHLTSDDRDRWLAARGAAGLDWWTGSGLSDYAVGAGDFAESFAVWQVGGTSLSTVAGQPTPAQLEVLAGLVDG